MFQPIRKSVLINASPSVVWRILTDIDLMKQWMGDPEMNLEISTDWNVGSPIVITGFHHARFENKGIVLKFDRGVILSYTHLNSLSRLPDQPENHSIIEFRLEAMESKTLLILTINNFPTESIYRHLDFYWTTTLEIVKGLAEKQ